MEKFKKLKSAPTRLAMPDVPEPTSFALTKNFHVSSKDIINKVLKILNIKHRKNLRDLNLPKFHDQPGEWFRGPF